MAVTKILPRNGGLKEAIDYVLNGDKTDGHILTAHFNCDPGREYREMMKTKRETGRLDKRQCYHIIQSFKPGEITPELALEIAKAFAQEHLDGFEVVIGTHVDRHHIHSHIVFNSVNADTGEKYHSTQQSYYQQIRAISDRLCREHGLSVIVQGAPARSVSYIEWLRQSKGQPTFRSMLEADLRDAIRDANDLGHFFLLMEHKGYEIHHGGRLGFRLRGQEQFQYPGRRDPLFTEDGIRAAIQGNLEQIEAGLRPVLPVRPAYQPYRKHPKYSGFLALYVHYLYLLGKIEKRQYPPRMTPHLRQAVMRFERYQAQFAFLRENDITTLADMAAFEQRTEETLGRLTKQRTLLNVRKKKRQPLYAALADAEALEPSRALYEEGLTGMEQEFEQYMKAVKLLEDSGIPQEVLKKEKAELYEQLSEVNRNIRAEREKLKLCREICRQTPVAAYCRVSTDSEEQLNSYEAQKTYYTQKIQDSPDWEMAGIYADEGISGTSLKKRTQFNKMITACKRGHIDLIITKSLSRFARNTVDCLDTVRLLKANGIGVYFEKENINTLTESSEFLITLFSGFAQAESESLSKNVAWGKQKSAEAGKVTFQYKKMLGYRKGADGQPEIVPEEAEIIRRIYHRYLDGCTLGQIKRELDEDGVPTAQGVERWSPSIIHNILTNEKYIGDALLQKTYVTDCINKKVKKNRGERTMYYVENSHPAIVSRDLFNQVQQEMTRRSSKRKVLQKSGKTELGKYSGKYALTELLVCGECGSPYKRVTWARNGKKRIVWRCVSRLEFGTKYCQHSPTLDEGKLHSAILAAMNEYAAIRQEVCPDVLAMAEEARQALSQAGARLLQLKKRMDAVSREQSDVLDRLLVNMADTELNARMKALTDEKESLKAQIADAQQAEVDLEEQAARRRQMWDSIMECAAGYTEFDNELVRQVIQKITVEDAETIHIHFRDSDVVLEQEVE